LGDFGEAQYNMEVIMNLLKYFSCLIIAFMGISCLVSCKNNNEYKNKFAIDQETEVRMEAEKIINEFGYSNFKIFTYFHKDIDQKIVSKSVTINRAVGNGILPLIEQYTGGHSISISSDFDGYFENRSVIVNYNGNDTRNEVIYEYLSIIIIFDEISNDQKNELLKLLSIFIINSNRGDTIYIVSRDEMKNK
jgi:hypothetical protein